MADPNATGGGTQNTPAQGDDNSNNPDFVTKEEMTSIVNAAVTSQLKRSLSKSIAEALGPALESALKPIQEKLEKPSNEPAAGDKKQDDPQVTALKKQIDDMSTLLKQSQETAEAEKRKSQEQTARGALRSALTGKVRPEAVDDVVDLLFYRKRVAYDDQGNLTFTWRSALSKGLPEEDHQFPLEDGVNQFLKSKQAEIYLPPPNADKGGVKPGAKLPNGNGTLPSIQRYDKPAMTDEEKLRRSLELTSALEARGVQIP